MAKLEQSGVNSDATPKATVCVELLLWHWAIHYVHTFGKRSAHLCIFNDAALWGLIWSYYYMPVVTQGKIVELSLMFFFYLS